RSGRAPAAALVHKPAPWAQQAHHAPNRVLLLAGKPEEQQSRAHDVKRALPQLFDRIAENVVPANLEIGGLHPLEEADIDVCRNDEPGLPDALCHPNCNRAATRSDLPPPPAALHEVTELACRRVIDLLQKL